MHPDLVLDLGEVAVEFAAKVDQQSVVGKFEEGFHDILGRWRGGQRADAQEGLLLQGHLGKVLQPGTSSGKRNPRRHEILCEWLMQIS